MSFTNPTITADPPPALARQERTAERLITPQNDEAGEDGADTATHRHNEILLIKGSGHSLFHLVGGVTTGLL